MREIALVKIGNRRTNESSIENWKGVVMMKERKKERKEKRERKEKPVVGRMVVHEGRNKR